VGSIAYRRWRQAEVSAHKFSSPDLSFIATAFLISPPPAPERRPLTEADAVDIWIARWLRARPKNLVRRYACDPRRLYEIWEETRFQGSRAKALALLAERYPGVQGRFDPGPHKRISLEADPRQMSLLYSCDCPFLATF
jgi:hypothetical protein